MGQECITACCPTEGTCVLAGTTGKRRCTKPPTLAASPVASLTATAASGLATATVKLAAAPVTSANGGGALGAVPLVQALLCPLLTDGQLHFCLPQEWVAG